MGVLSYAHGTYAEPLLGETIGEQPRAHGRARAGLATALISCHQGARFTYAELDDAVDRLAARDARPRDSRRATASACGRRTAPSGRCVQYATAKLGVILVNINPAYRTSELEYALGQSGCRWLFAAPELKGSDFARDGRLESAPNLPGARAGGVLRHRRVGGARRRRRRRPDALRARSASSTSTTRSTSSTRAARPASRRARRSPTTTSSTTATSSAGLLGYTEADRVCIPVPLYHCFGMVMGNLGCTNSRRLHRLPGRDVRSRGDARGLRERALHEPLRRADDVHRAARPPRASTSFDLSSLRTGIMAGSPCPIEVMKRVVERHGHRRDVDRFGMTETSPVTTQIRADDTLENRCGTVGQVMPHVEIKIVDPATGPDAAARRAGRVPAPAATR